MSQDASETVQLSLSHSSSTIPSPQKGEGASMSNIPVEHVELDNAPKKRYLYAANDTSSAPIEETPLVTEVFESLDERVRKVVKRKTEDKNGGVVVGVDEGIVEGMRQPLLEEGDEKPSYGDDVDEMKDQFKGKGTVRGSMFNMVNTMLGAGIIALPFAIKCTGLLGGLGILIIVGWFSKFSIDMLIEASDISGKISYDGLGQAAFGMLGHKVVQIVEIFNTIGALAFYLVLIADQATDLSAAIFGKMGPARIHTEWYLGREFQLLVLLLVIVLPLALQKRIDNLKYASLFSICCSFYIGSLVIIKGFIHLAGGDLGPNVPKLCTMSMFKADTSWFQAIPIMALAYTVHINVMHIYRELKNRTPRRMGIVSNYSIFSVIVFYGMIGGLGYCQFCELTYGDFLRSYGLDVDASIVVARASMLIVLLLTYPIICYPCRNALRQILYGEGSSLHRPACLTDNILHIILTFFVLGVTYLIAILVHGVSDISSLVGAITSTSLVFILPSVIYLKVTGDNIVRVKSKSKRDHGHGDEGEQTHTQTKSVNDDDNDTIPGTGTDLKWWKPVTGKRVVAWCVLGAGCVISVISTVVTILNWGQDK